MRKFLIPLTAAVSTVAFAAPASAQWFPQPQGYGYGYNDYGHQRYRGVAHPRQFEARIERSQRQIANMAARGMISPRAAHWLHGEARESKRLVRRYAPGGISGREAHALQRNIALLERRVAQGGRRDYDRGYGYHPAYGYDQGYGYNPGYDYDGGYYGGYDY